MCEASGHTEKRKINYREWNQEKNQLQCMEESRRAGGPGLTPCHHIPGLFLRKRRECRHVRCAVSAQAMSLNPPYSKDPEEHKEVGNSPKGPTDSI